MDPFATTREHGGHGMLRQPIDLEVGVAAAEIVRDRHVALGVTQADRRRDVERPARSAQPVGPSAPSAHPVPPAGSERAKSRRSRLTRTGSRALGMWPPPTIVSIRPPVALASSTPTA